MYVKISRVILCTQVFVSDRKIDEELGSTQRFQCAAEELMRSIRSFGEGTQRQSYALASPQV